jgi:crossover junction endodeoxyribonuclease RuvC
MPIMEIGKRKTPNPYALDELLEELRPEVVGIEWVVPMSQHRGRNGVVHATGIASTGNFLYGAGVLFGVAGARGHQVEFVTPAQWKRHFNLLGKSKEASRSLALRLFPRLATYLKRKKDADRAEALLMAKWYVSRMHATA